MTPAPRPFWFLRHGETDWNVRGLSQGHADIPLNATGRAQAERAARLLAGRGIVRIHASPLSRAAETARIVAAALAVPLAFDPDLMETRFGVQEGQPMGDWYDDWIAGRFTPEGGESFAALRARAIAAIDRATAAPGLALIVAHGAWWRAFRQAAGLPANIRTPNALPLLAEPGRPWRLT
ncbi:MAG: histidine phosphatase family protein, partial [Acetobacteraceae bacterium]|nr:histidine phosphatase family protein [Acetobacteraceae bacterium]